jgi:muramoyltetrapeptide carboxypeptidase
MPSPLRPGSRVTITSPAGPVLPQHLATGLAQLEAWGLIPVLSPQTYDRLDRPRGYLAGDDDARAAALNAAIADDSDAIIFSRGGYGAMRLLERLDWSPLLARPKILMGFSDITALLIAAHTSIGLSSLHGPVVKSFSLYPEHDDPSLTRQHTRDALFGLRAPGWQLSGLTTARHGLASGPLIGGNLCLLAALCGTPWRAPCAGALVFIEEVGEQDYRLDRLLTQLRLSWRHAPPAGLLVGDLSGAAGVYAHEQEIPDLIRQLARDLDIPAVTNLPIGHGARNVPLPIGVHATLDASAGVLTVHGDCAHG